MATRYGILCIDVGDGASGTAKRRYKDDSDDDKHNPIHGSRY